MWKSLADYLFSIQAVLAYHFEYHLDLQAATGANGDFLSVAQVLEEDLELIATRTWVGVKAGCWMVGHVLDLDLVVERHDGLLSKLSGST